MSSEFDKIVLSQKQKEQFEQLYGLLISENEKYNLTAITDKNEVFDKHFFDSLLAVKHIKQNATLCDIGCGGGFPSIPLAIMREDVSVSGIDGTRKKIDFCALAAKTLNLKNAVFFWKRAEELAKTHREVYDVVVARAVAPTNTLLEYCAPLVNIGGKAILYKTDGNTADFSICKHLGFDNAEYDDYDLAYGKRRVIILKKVAHCPAKYPRGSNLPRKQPL